MKNIEIENAALAAELEEDDERGPSRGNSRPNDNGRQLMKDQRGAGQQQRQQVSDD